MVGHSGNVASVPKTPLSVILVFFLDMHVWNSIAYLFFF